MQITSVRTIKLAAPIPEERRWRNDAGTRVRHEAALIEITTDTGLQGIGEAKGAPAVVESLVATRLEPLLLGADPTKGQLLWERMYSGPRLTLALRHGRPYHVPNARGELLCAISGVDVALWDLAGKALGVSVQQLQGGTVRSRLHAYASGGWAPPGRAGDEVAGYLDAGFDAVKIRVGGIDADDFPGRSLRRLAEVRSMLGPTAALMMDAHGALTPQQALVLAHGAEEFGVTWFEEPVKAADDLAGLSMVRGRTTLPIATGESEQTRFAFRDIIAADAADILQPDLAICGGLTEGRRIAALADAHGIVVNPHNWGTAVLWAASAHFAATTLNCTYLEMPQGYQPLLTELIEQPIVVGSDGTIEPPKGPGLGIELRDDIESRFPFS